MEYYKSIIGILIVVALAIAGYTAYEDSQGVAVCVAGHGCSEVRHGEYGEIFGYKVSFFGTAALAGLLVVHFLSYKRKIPYKFFLLATYVGAGFAAYFIYLQLFVIGAVCTNCVVIDSAVLVVFLLANYEYFKLQKKH